MTGPESHPLGAGTTRAPVPLSADTPADLRDLANRLHQALGEQYVVESVLGTGGFAAVFRVRDTNLKRDLAVKVLNPDLLASTKTRERFQREAETVARLSHPNVVQVHFIGRKDDLLYIGMPCIEGGRLSDRLAREGALPIGDAIRVITEIAGALGHAHKKGIVHRDIKTQNVMIDADGGRCLVTDFGIARANDASSALTSVGMVIGTPSYLSPEQISGDPSDHRADIYALGVLAYEIVAGRLPFEGTNTMAVMMRRFDGPPDPVSSVRPGVPAFLEQIIATCLAFDAAERFQSCDEILTALQAAAMTPTDLVRASGTQAPAVTASSRLLRESVANAPDVASVPSVSRRRVFAWSAGALLVVLAVAIALRSAIFKPSAPATLAVDPSLVSIPAGLYTIGNNSGPVDARPAHGVALAAFKIGAREVSNAEYAVAARAAGKPIPLPFKPEDGALPVTGIAWNDANSYCATRYNNGRLPSEEEWEASARGRAGRSTPWDNATPGVHANLAGASLVGPAPVGTYAIGATPEGVYDLLGNVWEWTSSAYRAYPGGSVKTPPAGTFYVIRGGAFDTPNAVATPWYRVFANANGSLTELEKTGFRCAVPADTPK